MVETLNENNILYHMEHLETLAQSYTQAPWRRQLQLIGLFLLFLVGIGVIAGIYLSVSAEATEVGRDIQSKQRWIEVYDREIEDRRSRLAGIMAFDAMEVRALGMGFQPIQPDQVVYLNIPGYIEPPAVVLAQNTPRQIAAAPVVPVEFTESLFAWIQRKLVENDNLFTVDLP